MRPIAIACLAVWLAQAQSSKTILDLQQFRQTNSVHFLTKDGKSGLATLINLNPSVNAWYVLKVAWNGGPESTYHLENPKPATQKLLLQPSGLVIVEGGNRCNCELFAGDTLTQAKASRTIYQPLCDGRIYLRNPGVGRRSTLEAAAEFLRDRVWGGEEIIALGHAVLGERNRETGTIEARSTEGEPSQRGGPLAARIDSQFAARSLASNNLGIGLGGLEKTGMAPGQWYPAEGIPGVWVSILQPNLIDSAILKSYQTIVNRLDPVEASALCYLVAFDLNQVDLGYALGTDHPRVGWSERAPAQMRDPNIPGPDGIGDTAPLVSTGLVAPEFAPRTVATFIGGFKRTHGAFKYGELALRNHGSHYGFIEEGVVFSTLQPGLATIFILSDGSVQMKTWTEADNQLLARIKHARQNGVPLVEFDDATRSTIPGRLVAHWGPGNWSGSEDSKLRTMRSGVALQQNGARRFLIYADFSDATPSAMARIFQAYQCRYAMLLDMNALEHTYCAVYRRTGTRLAVLHLIKGMSELDKSAPSGEVLPRFLALADNRDFFYVTRRARQEVKP